MVLISANNQLKITEKKKNSNIRIDPFIIINHSYHKYIALNMNSKYLVYTY